MKRNFTICASVFSVFIAVLFVSTRLVSNSAQPPSPFTGSSTFSYGIAGDPGQTTCNHCHTGTTRIDASKFTIKIAPDSAGLIGTANVVTSSTQYTPDREQWVAIELNGTNGSTPKFGFQLTALDSANNMAGAFTLTNIPTTSTGTSVATGRQYVGHRIASATTKAWSFKWTAPHSGPVTFYYCANFANGDGDDLAPGDSVYASTATLTAGPESHVGIADLSDVSAMTAYPLPFTHSLTLGFELAKSVDMTISLLSLNGAEVRALYQGNVQAGRVDKSFDLSGVSSGAYLVRMTSGDGQKVVMAIKL